MKYVMNHMRSANEAERQKGDENKKFSLEGGNFAAAYWRHLKKDAEI